MSDAFSTLFGNQQQPQQNAAPTNGALPVPQAPPPAAPPMGVPATDTDVVALIARSTPSASTAKFTEGVYPCIELQEIKIVKSSKNQHRWGVAEFIILKSGVEARPAGMVVGWATDLDGNYPEANAGEFRGLMAAIMDCGVEQVDNDVIRELLKPAQIMSGRLLTAEGYCKEGKTFVNVRWGSVPGTLDQHKAAGAQLKETLNTVPF